MRNRLTWKLAIKTCICVCNYCHINCSTELKMQIQQADSQARSREGWPGAAAPPPKFVFCLPKILKNTHFSSYHFTICIIIYKHLFQNLFFIPKKSLAFHPKKFHSPLRNSGWLRACTQVLSVKADE